MCAALDHPHKIARLILLASTPRFVATNDWEHGMAAGDLQDFGAALIADPQATLLRFLSLQTRGMAGQKALLQQLRQMLRDTPASDGEALAAGLAILRDTDLRAELPRVTQSTLVLHGALDTLTPRLRASGYRQRCLPPGTSSLPVPRMRRTVASRRGGRRNRAVCAWLTSVAVPPLPNPPRKRGGANAMPKPIDELDFAEVRRAFDHAAASYDAHAVLQREVCDRLLERLDFMSLHPARVLDIGSGTGYGLAHLRTRYAEAELCALDIAPAMLAAARVRLPQSTWAQRTLARLTLAAAPPTHLICADMDRLPLPPAA